MAMRSTPLAALSLLAFALAAPAVPAETGADPAALVIRPGSVARSHVVAVARDLVVEGEAQSDVAALNGSIDVSGAVAGDVIVLGGDARLTGSARIGGDVFVLGGRIEAGAGAVIDGRSVAYPSVGSAWLLLLEGPALGLAPLSSVVVSAKLALIAAWLAWTLVLFAATGREVLATSEGVRREPFRNFFVGLAGVFALFLTGLFFSAFAAALVGLPLLLIVCLVALLLKLWGMVGVFHAAGAWILGQLGRLGARRKLRLLPLNVAVVGLTAIGLVKLMPWVGTWVWTIASLIGVGAALTTKLGRREPWFAAPDPRAGLLIETR